MFLELVAFFQDARRRSADDAPWYGKREIYFKGCRLRYLATRDGMALAVRRCVTGISSTRLGVAFLVDIHRTSVNRREVRFAAACMASRKAWYRDAQEKLTLQTKRIESHWSRLSLRTASSQRRLHQHSCQQKDEAAQLQNNVHMYCAGRRQEDDVD